MHTSRLATKCYHCGNEFQVNKHHSSDEKTFCCSGCKSVYELLNENNLCNYYELNEHPGQFVQKEIRKEKYAFLEDPKIQAQLIQFQNKNFTHLTFYIPQIHCSSCLFLLENIYKFDSGIISSYVNFERKEVFIQFNNEKTSLRNVVETLEKIGYEPHLSLKGFESSPQAYDKALLYKIGFAGFAFANIMIYSLADYFAVQDPIEAKLDLLFKYFSLILSIPVLVYSASDFFRSAANSLKQRYINIDVPIALALIITFSKSVYEISTQTGSGYLDSMAGIVFFMLLGRWMQSKTISSLSFDRNFRNFFPIAVNKIVDGKGVPTLISELQEKDIFQIHSQEIIPVDCILSKGIAKLDYSFVNGESDIHEASIGELIYAGARQTGSKIELITLKPLSQNYLNNLWNNPRYNKKENSGFQILFDKIALYFTIGVLLLGFGSFAYFYFQGEYQLMWNALTTVLIVACPCALLLSQTYTYGHILNLFQKNKFFIRNAEVISALSEIKHIVFDKTGTITEIGNSSVKYFGRKLKPQEMENIYSILSNSMHPASQNVLSYLNLKEAKFIEHFKETLGSGIEAWIDDQHYKMGSVQFVGSQSQTDIMGTRIVVAIDQEIVGEFVIETPYKKGIKALFQKLTKQFKLSILTGDNDRERENLKKLVSEETELKFYQSPEQKMNYIQQLQEQKSVPVMMVGDGLNDAGALLQSHVGVAVMNQANSFTPSSDAIIASDSLDKLDSLIQLSAKSKSIINYTFIISAIYNLTGLYYAIQGTLSPVIAAILMPISSISIIGISYFWSRYSAKKLGLKIN